VVELCMVSLLTRATPESLRDEYRTHYKALFICHVYSTYFTLLVGDAAYKWRKLFPIIHKGYLSVNPLQSVSNTGKEDSLSRN